MQGLQACVPEYVVAELAVVEDRASVPAAARWPAIVLLVDLAGFTSLSEELGAMGKSGADTLSHILNSCFAPLIASAHAYGGMISTFGGDALTIIFPLNDAPRATVARRAISCAAQMQATVRGFSSIETPSGPWSLTLKAAIAEGDVLYVTVGDPSMRLVPVVAGDALLRSGYVQRRARAGQIVVDAGLRAFAEGWTLPEGLVVVERMWGRPEPMAPLSPPPPLGPAALERLRAYVHPALINRLGEEQMALLGERRAVTAMFVAFKGIDYGHDDAAELLRDYLDQVLTVVEHYGGFLSKVEVGDKGSTYLVLWGAPVAYENDVERALHCALELLALGDVAIQIGINTGFAFCGMVGSAERQEYTVIGDTVNLAARLMVMALPGQIIVGQGMVAVAEQQFQLNRLPPRRVKGKRELVAAWELVGLRRTSFRIQEPTYDQPLIGRDAELGQVTGLLEAVRGGQGQIIAVVGAAGMGKSRLGAEIRRLARARRIVVHNGECLSYGTTSSYFVWHGLLRAFFNVDPAWPHAMQLLQLRAQLALIAPESLEWAPLLASALRLPLEDSVAERLPDSKTRKMILEALLVACVRYRAEEAPLLLVFEDCHWIDPLSLEALELLAGSMGDVGVGLVLISRPMEDNPTLAQVVQRLRELEHYHEFGLSELSDAETATMIQQRLRQAFDEQIQIPEPLIARVAARSQGNPFYVEELINLVVDRGLEGGAVEHLATLELPDSLHRLIISRIDRLEEGPRLLLRIASVIGRVVPLDWLTSAFPQLGPPTTIAEALGALRDLDLLQADPSAGGKTWLFTHIVTQEVAYESLSDAARAQLHEQLAHYIEDQSDLAPDERLELLAHHYGHSGNRAKQRAYLRLAGDRAAARFAADTARMHYRRLLALLEPAERPPIFLALGQVLALKGSWAEAEALYRELLALAAQQQDHLLIARAWYELSNIMSNHGRHEAALDYTAEAEIHCKDRDRRLWVQILIRRGWTLSYCGRIREALGVAERAVVLSDATADQRLITQTLRLEGYMNTLLGTYDKAMESFRRALAIVQRLGLREDEARFFNVMGEAERQRGDAVAAAELYRSALAIGRELHHPERLIMYLSNLGGALVDLRRFQEARTLLEEALQLAESTTWYGVAETERFLAEARAGLGDRPGAYAAALSSLRQARAGAMRAEEAAALRTLANLGPPFSGSLPEDDLPATAADCFAAAVALFQAVEIPSEEARTWAAWERAIIAQGGPVGEARRCAANARTIAKRHGLRIALNDQR